jgi:hypothetical protein
LDGEKGRALESLDGSARGGRKKKKKKKKVQLGLDEGTAGAFGLQGAEGNQETELGL